MLIPVRCFSCGKPIGHLWEKFQEETQKGKDPKEVMDQLGLRRYCCRRMVVSHEDHIDEVNRYSIY